MLRSRAGILVILLIIASTTFSQQQKWPNTLLWKISGNGLEKPSYLYGTMHLQDKRLFQFTDSVYSSLEKVDGFALEIDFNELMDSIFKRGFREAENEVLDKEDVKLDKKKIDRSVDSIMKELDLDPESLTKKDLKKIRDYRMNKLVQQGEMNTIVDGYLYGLALRMGKWVGGIEDVSDQLDLKDELGADLSPEEVFMPEKNLKSGLEELIKIYINSDLQSIAEYVDGKYHQDIMDKLLVQRNIKMAKRMDSLSSQRTMFFAVGAAHLPGETGVISLLREKGFVVSPVFSTQSITPEKYADKLQKLPWQKVENEAYQVEMPGMPGEHAMFGQMLKMKVYFDLPSMTFYMSGHTIASSGTADIDKAFANMADKMGNKEKKIKTKNISYGEIKGKEGSFDTQSGALRMRMMKKNNSVYFLMVVSTKKSNLDNQDVNKYFNSFLAKEFNASAEWTRFSIPGKGFTIDLPGTPKPNPVIDEKAEGSQWKFHTYDLVDNQKGMYYLIQVREIGAGYYLEGDSSYFSLYKQDISSRFEKMISEEQFSFGGWPAFRLEVSLKPDALFRMFNVIRGNRVYAIVVGGSDGADFSDAERAFSSFQLLEYEEESWSDLQTESFYTKAPASFIKNAVDSTLASSEEHFTSYDENTSVSFEVFKTVVSPFYWIKNDSTYYDLQVNAYKDYNDSVIHKQTVYNGNLKGIDYLLEKNNNNTLRKVRMFVNKDTLYALVAYIPKQMKDDRNVNLFFSEFSVRNEVMPVIYENKSRQLLQALRSDDSATFYSALSVLEQVSFSKDELPMLHEALVESYQETEDYYTVNDKISQVLEDMADGSTLKFIEKNYHGLENEKEHVKINMLQVLAHTKTLESYDLFKRLLIADPPAHGNADELNYPLHDSLSLTRTLFPELLSLASDSIMGEVVADVALVLLDSALITREDILPARQIFLQQAITKLQAIGEENENQPLLYRWIGILGHLNDTESNEVLKQVAALDDLEYKYDAILKLVKNNTVVDEKEILKLAEDRSYRKFIYSQLKELGKLSLYPAKYATRIRLAESEMFVIASDDYEPSKLVYLGERTVTFMGTKQKFLLFQVTFEGEEFSETYLGITGPYDLKGKDMLTDTDASGIYWAEEFELPKLDLQLSELLKSMETYLIESKK